MKSTINSGSVRCVMTKSRLGWVGAFFVLPQGKKIKDDKKRVAQDPRSWMELQNVEKMKGGEGNNSGWGQEERKEARRSGLDKGDSAW